MQHNKKLRNIARPQPHTVSLLFSCFSPDKTGRSVFQDTHIFLLDGALFTVVGIRYSGSAADDAAPLIGAVVAFITDAHQRAWPHIGVTDDTFPITCGEKGQMRGLRM